MHSLNDISAVIKYSTDILSVDGTGEVGVAVVLPVPARRTYTLQSQKKRDFNFQLLYACIQVPPYYCCGWWAHGHASCLFDNRN